MNDLHLHCGVAEARHGVRHVMQQQHDPHDRGTPRLVLVSKRLEKEGLSAGHKQISPTRLDNMTAAASSSSDTSTHQNNMTAAASSCSDSATLPKFSDRVLPTYTLADVATHNTVDDCWIVVHDVVYDMTAHVKNHEGWVNGSKQSTLLAVLSAMGCDCTLDFDAAGHSRHAMAQLAAVRIGVLDPPNTERGYIRYRSWEDLVAEGVVPAS